MYKNPLRHEYKFTSIDGEKSFRNMSLSDSGCDKTVISQNLLDKHGINYLPNRDGERLLAAGDHELSVTGVLDLQGTYDDKTVTMKCLVTPDLRNETIISLADAEEFGAIWINPKHSNRQPLSRRLKTLMRCRRKKTAYAKQKMNQKAEPFRQLATQDKAQETLSATSVKTAQETLSATPVNKAQETLSATPVNKAQETLGATTVDTAQGTLSATSVNKAQETPGAIKKAQESLSAQKSKEKNEKGNAPGQAEPLSAPEIVYMKRDMFSRAYPQEKRFELMVEALSEEFSCLTNVLPDKPMKGEPMVINLVKGWEKRVPKRATSHIPVPYHLKIPGDAELDHLIASGIIKQIGHSAPRPFCARAFFVLKTANVEDGVRLVTDFSEINKLVDRPEHPFIPGPDVLKRIPASAKVYAKVDMLKGYNQIAMAEESQYITAFITERGVFVYLRAPIGLNASGDEFNRRADDVLAGLEGYVKLIDDILIYADNEEELYERLRALLERCQEANIALKKSKFQIARKLTFAGYEISDEGRRPTMERLAAIRDFPTPTDKSGLRSFTSLAQQIGNWMPDVAHMTKRMTDMQGKREFRWDAEMDAVLQKCKDLLTNPTTLKHFDPKLSTTLLTDACKIGLGYLLVQQKDPEREVFNLIECGSRKTTPTEANYAPCELETLGLTWAIKKCRYYLLGMENFTVLTDHSSLKQTFTQPLDQLPNPRQRRMREKVLEYNFTVVWIEGKKNVMADALSRYPVFPSEVDEEEEAWSCRALRKMETHEDPALTPLIKAAHNDVEYCLLREAIRSSKLTSGLVNNHPARTTYKSVWKRLSLEPCGLVVLDNSKILVPAPCRKDIVEQLHKAHCGQQKSVMRANMDYFWSGMSTQINNRLDKCPPCRKLRATQQQQPIIQCNEAKAPMEVVGIDLMQERRKDYLVMVDQYSGFPMVEKLHSTDTSTVKKKLRDWFTFCGLPEKAFSDGGPQFRTEFKKFCEDFKIIHIVSSSYHPQSNGLAESGVKQVKYLMKKYESDWDEFMWGLLEWRNTPNTASGKSPAQMFFGRRQRTLLPTLPGKTKFDLEAAEEGAQRRKENREKQYAERHTKELPPLEVGERILIQTPEGWDTKATILKSHHEGRSYDVRLDNGAEKTLNRRILMPMNDPDAPDTQEIIHESEESQEKAGPQREPQEEKVAADNAPILRRSERKRHKQVCSCCKLLQCDDNIRQILI